MPVKILAIGFVVKENKGKTNTKKWRYFWNHDYFPEKHWARYVPHLVLRFGSVANFFVFPFITGKYNFRKVVSTIFLVGKKSLGNSHPIWNGVSAMLRVSKNPFVFVGKKELAKIPVFGFFFKRVCIMVDREDTRSRTGVYRRAQRRLNQGLSICIFPEGGVPEEHVLLDSFKDGAFKMAIAHDIPVVPMTFYDSKERFSFTFLSGSPGRLRAKVHTFFETGLLDEEDKGTLREEVREVILNELKQNKRLA